MGTSYRCLVIEKIERKTGGKRHQPAWSYSRD